MRKHKRRNHQRPPVPDLRLLAEQGGNVSGHPSRSASSPNALSTLKHSLYTCRLHGTVPGPAPVQLFPCKLPAYREPAPDAAPLNADITAAEVKRALRRAKRGKAAGHDGLSADLLKDAALALLDEYAHLFSVMLAGDIPDALSMGLITAIHKTVTNVTWPMTDASQSHRHSRRCLILS